MRSSTPFNTAEHHIYTRLKIVSARGRTFELRAILDTGAPGTEISDRSLKKIGYPLRPSNLKPKKHQQTRKYSKIRLTQASVLGQTLTDWIVRVSKFDESWQVDALIGLDFFRKFKVTVNYKEGMLLAEPY